MIDSEEANNINNDDSNEFDCTPRCGMEFDSQEAAYNLYNAYGRKVGFSIRKERHYKNKKTNEVTSRIFACSKEGFRLQDKRDYKIKKPRAETRTGCHAKMVIKLNRSNGRFFVHEFEEQHNHALQKPECAHMLPSQRKISDSQAAELDLAEESGISLRESYELMAKHVGGRESLGYTRVDQKNYLLSRRQRKMVYGEAGSLLRYFQGKTVENPSFFYAVQLDNEEQITNIFWADAKMISDYGHFGDVVSFDTTYKTNRAGRPFAVFSGLNHHREIVVFGAALMYDETAPSFIWLFETFLVAMSNKAPKTIFTDQDAAMMNAIPHVMPDTYHRLCLWHMMQNALKNVNCVFKGNSGVREVLKKFIDEYEDEDEFLVAWDEMLVKHNVQGKALEWLKGIKKLRKKWAKAYVKMAWSAGMTTTGISESFNGRLKEYLQSDYNVVQFFMHFERVLDDQRYKEYQAEYNLCYKNAQVKVPAMMVKQAGDTYTKAIFEEFQEQYGESLDLRIKSTVDDGEVVVYTVFPPYGAFMERHVRRERDSNIIWCSCRLFEIKGILCSHAIKILREVMDTLEIPSQYILKRWTKKARAESIQDMHGKEIQVDPRLQQSSRFRSLCHAFTQISSRAAESDETYEIALSCAHKLGKLTEDKLSLQINGKTEDEGEDSAPIMALNHSNDVPNLNNATVVQAKGLKKRETCRGRRRLKSCLEKAIAKRKRSSNSHLSKETCVPNETVAAGCYIASPPPFFCAPVMAEPRGPFPVVSTLNSSQGHDMLKYMPWMTYEEPQYSTFQELLQTSPTGYSVAHQDLNVSGDHWR
ncbi:hypothetical protein FF1_016936 [Malus domestica]